MEGVEQSLTTLVVILTLSTSVAQLMDTAEALENTAPVTHA